MENTENTEGKQDLRKSLPQLYPKGVSGNPAGRPKGSRNFTTDFEEAIKGIKDKETGEQLTMEKIVKIGITKMLKGDAKFEGLYKDLLDRYYGKPVQTTDITTQGEKIQAITWLPPKEENE